MRHGAKAELTASVAIESAPAPWTGALIPLGGIVFVAVRAATRRVVTAPRWAFCTRCRSLRYLRMAAGFVLIGLMLAFLVVGLDAADTSYAGPAEHRSSWWAFAVALLAGVAGWIILVVSRWQSIARARLSRDGLSVDVRKPSVEFAAAVEAMWAPNTGTLPAVARPA
ncbi:hypothetical protein HDA40_005530 [Hamadaea flava]|uniref:Uncharacterized protein n=1 Tax=Hamadaea flava TaxID=1742688 RepID=A0ABV8M101_9ACTN|nr:hypothetical protein [Hamadaea flava]MCP2327023.1 hypothetical protein [Hamadaea flava]